MIIPQTGRKKALLIVDVQQSFIVERNKYILPNIIELIQNWKYDCIIYSISYNDPNSLWHKQIWWNEVIKEVDSLPVILNELGKYQNIYKTKKLSRSLFKWDLDVAWLLRFYWIEETHICGVESNDCVFATALESFDLGYYTFVIEEASETRTTQLNHTHVIQLLRYLNLTNNSNYVGKK